MSRPNNPSLGWLPGLFLALAVLVIYWPVTRHDFVNFDDHEYVSGNVHVLSGLTPASLKWAFSHQVCGNWHPVTMLSHMLDCQLFGLQPWGHHLTSLLLHALNTALLFLLLHRLTGTIWRSGLVAALFGLHPLHVESVAWVAERKDVLSTFFGLLALWFYGNYARARAAAGQEPGAADNGISAPHASLSYWLSWFCLALGLLSKPMLVTWPFVMLLLDYWPLERWQPGRWWLLVREKIPFFALALGMSAVAFLVQKDDGAMAGVESMPMGARVENALVAYTRYLGKLFWPADLAVFYPHPGYWPPGLVLLAAVLLVGLSVWFWTKRRGQPFLLVGWLWFVGTLVPVIGLVQVGGQAMADRYTYIPLVGALILVVWGAHAFVKRRDILQMALVVAGLAVIVACTAMTRQQIGYWQDSESLFRHALAVTANNELAHNNLGMSLDKQGRIDEAIIHYHEALRLQPDDVKALNNLGIDLVATGQIEEAISEYQQAIRCQPNFADAHYDLAIALSQQGRMAEAISEYQQVIRLQPDNPKAYNNLGNVLLSQGQADQAVPQYQEASRLQPEDAQPHSSLGVALLKQGQTDAAITQFEEAIHLKPEDAKAHNNLGNVLLSQGRTDAAVSQYQEAIRLKPDFAKAHNNLGLALDKNGQLAEAITQFQEALRFNPNYLEAQNNLDREFAKKAPETANSP